MGGGEERNEIPLSEKKSTPRDRSTGVWLIFARRPERGLTLALEITGGRATLSGKVEKESADLYT